MGLFGPPDVGTLEARRDVPRLVKVMTGREAVPVRIAATAALGRLGDPAAIAALLEVLGQGVVGAAAEQALGSLAATAWPALAAALVSTPPMQWSHGDKEDAARRVLTRLGEGIVPVLGATIAGPAGNARRQLLPSLLAMAGHSARATAAAGAALRTLLADADPTMRGEAASGLGALHVGAAAGDLATLLGDERDEVRVAARDALIALGPAALRVLLAAAAAPPLAVRRYAVWALGDVGAATGDPEVREPVFAALAAACGDADWQVRANAVVGLGQLGDGRGAPAAIARLADPHGDVRLRAAGALKHLYKSGVVGALLGVIGDPLKALRRAAAESLVALHRSGVLDAEDARLVLAHRAELAAPHHDQPPGHADKANHVDHREYAPASDCAEHGTSSHTDRWPVHGGRHLDRTWPHGDSGIGIDVPLAGSDPQVEPSRRGRVPL